MTRENCLKKLTLYSGLESGKKTVADHNIIYMHLMHVVCIISNINNYNYSQSKEIDCIPKYTSYIIIFDHFARNQFSSYFVSCGPFLKIEMTFPYHNNIQHRIRSLS